MQIPMLTYFLQYTDEFGFPAPAKCKRGRTEDGHGRHMPPNSGQSQFTEAPAPAGTPELGHTSIGLGRSCSKKAKINSQQTAWPGLFN